MKHPLEASPRFRHLLLMIATLGSMAGGCQKADRAHVSGKLVRADGTPLAGARVVARSTETGQSAFGATNSEGFFELGIAEGGDGVPPGNYEVFIVENRGDPDNRRPPTIAPKYAEPSTSGLSLTLEAGDDTELNAALDPH